MLVASCDAYSDLWVPFFTLLSHHWPDQSFPLYLGAGVTTFEFPRLTVLHSNGGKDWSQCMMDYLDQITAPWVILVLDDFFLRRRVINADVLSCLAFANNHSAIQVRLVPRPRPTRRVPGERLVGESEIGSPYRLAAQGAIWNRKKLRSLLRPKESIWEFEHRGNERASLELGGFFSVWRPVLTYQGFWAHHVVEKGKWLPHERRLFLRANIGVQPERRETLTFGQTTLYHTVQFVNWLLGLFGWKAQLRGRRLLRKIFRPILRTQIEKMGGRSPS